MIGQVKKFASLPDDIRNAVLALRGALIATALASGLVNLLMLVGPIFMLQTYDRVLPSRSTATLVGLLLIALILLLVQAGVDMLRGRLLARIAEISRRNHPRRRLRQRAAAAR